jgi:hypothetical protein
LLVRLIKVENSSAICSYDVLLDSKALFTPDSESIKAHLRLGAGQPQEQALTSSSPGTQSIDYFYTEPAFTPQTNNLRKKAPAPDSSLLNKSSATTQTRSITLWITKGLLHLNFHVTISPQQE